MSQLTVTIRNAVKGEIEGYLAIWGSPRQRDSYNTWFDRHRPPNFDILLPLRLLYKHGFDPVIGKTRIGKIVMVTMDKIGVRFRAILEDTPFKERIMREVSEGKLKVSSGSAEHLASFDSEGRFVEWLLSEVSLEDAPSESRMPAVVLIRSSKDSTIVLSTLQSTREGAALSHAGETARGTAQASSAAAIPPNRLGESKMKLQELLAQMGQGAQVSPEMLISAMIEEYGLDMVQQYISAMGQQAAAAPEASTGLSANFVQQMQSALDARRAANAQAQMATTLQGIQAQMEAMRTQMHSAPPVTPPTPPTPPQTPDIRGMEDLRYAHLSFSDMALGALVVRGNKGGTRKVSDTYRRVMAYKLAEAAEKGNKVATDHAVRSAFPLRHLRANEVMQSDLASGGDEWVGVAYSTDLWEKARAARIYQELLSRGMMDLEIPQGMESIYVPTEGADPTWYSTVQAEDVDATNRPEVTTKTSTVGTGRRQLTPGEAKASVIWNDTLEEDSLIPVLPQIRYQMDESAEDAIEYVIFNGDTVTSADTNINLIDGTPATGLSTPVYLVTDGIIKLPLVTHTARSRDAGALDEDDYRLTYSLLPFALRADKSRLMFVVDGDTEVASMAIASFKTRDVNSMATIENGELTKVFGVKVFTSGQIALANTAGKISTTGSNNTKGRILCVVPRYWAIGRKRNVTIESDRDILSGSNIIVASMRFGVQYRTVEAAAISYNVTVS